ncbi:class I SAM-dependent methyltransferase [Litoribrevibacter euphylliae]|uniref:Class I SAM-dependent methyltransferase n=1 Tax=Litoribrevibacter euphylliae TaxID=1834034 RepID=A0ABV7HGA2_9GAMM
MTSQTENIDPAAVTRYFNSVQPSIMGPYMMDGFGFPQTAGDYRFKEELKIVDQLLADLDSQHMALDLGSGVGFWAEAFAQRFTRVEAVEGSESLYQELLSRCSGLSNVQTHHADVLNYQPSEPFDVAFLGGLLMYLNDTDVVSLLNNLRRTQSFRANVSGAGKVLCRESTVRGQSITKQGEYSVIYRSVEHYQKLFQECGYHVKTVQPNDPYILMQTGCELIKKWKKHVPEKAQMLSLVGRATYLGLRLTNPWITKIPKALDVAFPELENHFFLLEPAE